jgi:hypothetical protein
MMDERGERGTPQEVHLTVGQNESTLRMVDGNTQGAIAIQVDDLTSKEQIGDAAKAALESRYWFADPRWESEALKERFRVDLGTHGVEIFAFGEELQEEVRNGIVRTLERFYNALADKTLWNLESIQVVPRQEINPKSGEPYRGMEFPTQRRLELYAAGLRQSAYRGGELPCSELEGTLAHEVTHVVLESSLAAAWQSEDLGWESDEETMIELPGGTKTMHRNTRPQECPTSYASMQPDDDRADSVAAYLFASDKLSQSRKQILDQVFTDEDSAITASSIALSPTLPKLPVEIPVNVTERRRNLFGGLSIRPGKERRVIALTQFRKEHGIPEPQF